MKTLDGTISASQRNSSNQPLCARVPRPQLRLSLLGGFSLQCDGAHVEVPESSQRVLVYLALRERPQARNVVASALWPDSIETRAAANLRSSLWRLPEVHGGGLCDAHGPLIGIAPDIDVDVRSVERDGWSLVSNATHCCEMDGRSFFEELLPGWYEDFVILERERLQQIRLHFLEALTWRLVEQRRHAEALDVALRLVATEPLRERSQRALIGAYRAEGNIAQAVRQYERYRVLLVETFGCSPSAELSRLAYGIDDELPVAACR